MKTDGQDWNKGYNQHGDLRLVLRVAAFALGASAVIVLLNREEGLSILAEHGLKDNREAVTQALNLKLKKLTDAGLEVSNVHSVTGLLGPQPFCALTGIISHEGRIGILAVLTEAPLDLEWDGRAELLRDLANLAALHLHTVRVEHEEASLTEELRALRDALEVLPEAVAIFDRHDRFLFWNQHFERVYAPPGVVIRAGSRFEDHLRACLDKGHVVAARGREEEWLAERLSRFHACDGAHEHQLGSGRWVRVQDRALPNGGKVGIRADVTEQVAREQSIRLLFNANPVPMLVIERDTLQILSVNAAAVAFYGYSETEFLALSLPQIRPESTPGEIRTQIESQIDPTIPNAVHVHFTSSGEQRVVKVRACVIDFGGRSAILAAVFDMTAQNRSEAEVQQARAFLKNVVDNIPTSVFVKDMWDGGRYVLYNRAGEMALGLSGAEIIGHTANELFPSKNVKHFVEQDEIAFRLEAGETADEQMIEDAKGRERWVRTRKVALADHGGKPRYVLGISDDITEQRAGEARIAHMAHHDALTGLPNRFLLRDRLEAALARVDGASELLAVLCIDLDGFKAINDAWGHAAGDQLLCEVASCMRELVRPSDTVSRVGGDEFVVLQAPIAQIAEAASLAGRLVANMSKPYFINGHQVRIGASIGIAVAPSEGRAGSALLERADAALYQAKRNGRNRFLFADPALNVHSDVALVAARFA